MKRIEIRLLVPSLVIMTMVTCQSPQNDSLSDSSDPVVSQTKLKYNGNLSSSKYDSVVNHLVLHPNESFDLNQVDRIAEHHLNEREFSGIYSYLADSTQLGLYTEDGVLMLRFLLVEQGLTPMTVGGESILDATNVWHLERPKEES